MRRRFDPVAFAGRVILVDLNRDPPGEFMNCLGCGQLVRELYKSDELCGACYAKWEKAFRERWIEARFGQQRHQGRS